MAVRPPGKARRHGCGPWGGQYLRQLLPVQVSQCQPPLAVQTAGNHRAVAQHGDLTPQAVAELRAAVRSRRIRPVKPFPRLQKQPLPQLQPSADRLRRWRDQHHHPGDQHPVHQHQRPRRLGGDVAGQHGLLGPGAQPQGAQDASAAEPLRRLPDTLQIRGCGILPPVSLEAVEGDAELVQGRGTLQCGQLPGKQRAVGHKAHPEAQLPGDIQQLRQPGMQQRLPHDVEHEIRPVGPQPGRQLPEFLRRHEPPGPLGAGAEGAPEIAHVGDLQIHPFEHPSPPLPPAAACCSLHYSKISVPAQGEPVSSCRRQKPLPFRIDRPAPGGVQ